MKRQIMFMLAAGIFAAAAGGAMPLSAQAASFKEYGGEIPVVENVEGVSRYSKETEWQVLTTEEAEAAGVKRSDGSYVARAALNQANGGFTLDFSSQEIPIYSVETIDFRVRAPKGTAEIRISVDLSTRWVMRYKVAVTDVGKFIKISLGADGTNFWEADGFTMDSLANAEGNLGAFELMFYTTMPGADVYAYLDSASVVSRPQDDEAPVIDYDGGTEVVTSAGRHFGTVFSATAYDEYEQRAVDVEYIFSDGAVDASGNLLEGDHTLIIRAADASGNTREIAVSLHVGAKDTAAPEISFPGGEIGQVKTVVGAYPDIRAVGTDNIDRVTVEESWSEGALDEFGRLTLGEHTCVLSCTDGTGNRTERTIRYIVTAESEPIVPAEEPEEKGCGAVALDGGFALLVLGAALVCCKKRR